MSQEVEIRLAARPDDLKRISQGRFVKKLSQGNAATRRYSTIYYDTPEFSLAKKGVSLRVRRSGRNYVQTIKEADEPQTYYGMACRTPGGEWQVPRQ